MSARRLIAGCGLAAAALAALAALALAAKVTIPGPDGFQQTLRLNTKGTAYFDVYQPPEQYHDDCALGDLGGPAADDVGFSPASDVAAAGGNDDLFDGGLVLAVRGGGGTTIFESRDHSGDLEGRQLTVGPERIRGLRVTRTERALATSPTLRSLITLRNPSRKTIRRTLIWDSDVGADHDEVVRASSSGDKKLTAADRWIVFADHPKSPSDPHGTFVLYGKGNGVKRTAIFNGVANADSCISFRIRVAVPPRATRHLLFFTEVHRNDAYTKALADARRYNRPSLDERRLGGIPAAVRKRIVNWDL